MWLRPFSAPRPTAAVRRGRTRRPRYSRLELERLEDRIVPSATVLSSYTGLDSAGFGGGFEPPDTQGAAGPSSVIETVNQGIGIYTPKSTGATPVTDTLSDFFFTQGGLANGGAAFGQTDPFTIYDPQVQRFIVGNLDFAVANTNGDGNYLLLAVSKSANPTTLTTADWNFSEVTTTETGVALQDYTGNPGYNADALIVTLNPFDSTGTPVGHSLVNAISMNALVNGTALTVGTNLFQTDYTGEFLMRPATMPDSTPGGPMWMVTAAGGGAFAGAANTIDVTEMTNVLSTTPTFTTTTLTVNPYYQAVVPVDSSGATIDSGTDSRMLQAGEQNGIVVAADEVANAAGNANLARWYAIDVSSGTPVIQQQGDVGGGPNTYYDYPGIGINAQGDIGMTYVASGAAPGMYESVYVTGRTPSDPAGTMETPVLVQAGTAGYVGTRQGDMSRIAVDPNGTFWAFSQWTNTEAAPNWGTAIANFTLAPPISVVLTNAVEGVPLTNVPVATFTDNSGVPLSSYTANIDWGDGTTSAGTVEAGSSSNTFVILGSHTYLEEGDYTLSVSESNGTTTLGPVFGVVSVADAPLIGSAQSLNGRAGAYVSNALVAVFEDTDSSLESASNYTATVQWFEGNGLSFSSGASIVPLSDNTFAVYASSPYSFPSGGLYTIRVVISDVGGASVTVDSVIDIGHNQAIPPLIPQVQLDSGPGNALFPPMQDALTNLILAERTAYFASKFGTLAQKEHDFANLTNAYLAYELAVLHYDLTLPGA
jgi:hypothetical protein